VGDEDQERLHRQAAELFRAEVRAWRDTPLPPS
jgi:hypothetical protein